MLINHKPCAYHPNSIITYFCGDKDCLLPLCNQCIPLHLEQRHPGPVNELKFKAIGESIFQVKQALLAHRKHLTSAAADLDDAARAVMVTVASVSQNLQQLVEQFLQEVTALLRNVVSVKIQELRQLELRQCESAGELIRSVNGVLRLVEQRVHDLHSDNAMAVLIEYHDKWERSIGQVTKSVEEGLNSRERVRSEVSGIVGRQAFNKIGGLVERVYGGLVKAFQVRTDLGKCGEIPT